MTRDDYVTFEQAKLLKEKGFPQNKYGSQYKENGEIENGFTDLGLGIYYAPTLSLVQKWLRNEKNTHILPYIVETPTDNLYSVDVYCPKHDGRNKPRHYFVNVEAKHEEALSAGINKALELIE